MSFVPTIERISAQEISEIPGLEELIEYWAEAPASNEAWFREAGERMGCGLVMRRNDEILGFALYAPPEYLPRAGRCGVGAPNPEAAVLAYISGDSRTRRHILVRVLKEMRQRDVPYIEAVSSDAGHPSHAATSFLLESGWRPVRRGWLRGRPYTLMRAELGSTVEVGELARGLIGKVRLPKLKPASPAPGAFVKKERPVALIKAEAPRS